MPIEKKSSTKFEDAIKEDSNKSSSSTLKKFLKNNILKIVIGTIVLIIIVGLIISNNKYKNTDEYKYQQAHNIYDVVDYNDAIIDNYNNNQKLEDIYMDGEGL